jgi:hypothetical protein
MPTPLPLPGGWEFEWPKERVVLALERLREHRDSITAEATVSIKGGGHLIGNIRFNLTSMQGRSSLAKSLNDRRNGVDWAGMVEQACVYTIRKFREEAPFEEVGQLPPGKETLWRLNPIVPEGLVSLLYGPGGIGKSTLAVYFGLLVQMGLNQLGLAAQAGPVLLLDWETNRQLVNDCQQAIAAAMGMPERPQFLYRRCRRPLVDMVEDVKATVQRQGIGLVIMDSAVKACGGEKEAKENALPMLNAAGALNVSVLLISHRGKMEEARLSYGSVFFMNDCRHVFEVRGGRQPGSSSASLGLWNVKSNVCAPLPPLGFRITWDNLLGIRVERQDVKDMADLRSQLPQAAQIRVALEHGKLTAQEIADETGLPLASVKVKLSSSPQFVNLGGRPAVWGLAAPQEYQGEEGVR